MNVFRRRAERRRDPWRCAGLTLRGSRCTNPGSRKALDGMWYCHLHHGGTR